MSAQRTRTRTRPPHTPVPARSLRPSPEPRTTGSPDAAHPLLDLQRTAGNRATTALIQRAAERHPTERHPTVQRDWTGDRTDEITHLMVDGLDWNRDNGPWWVLNSHNPDALVGILRRMGAANRARLAAHPADPGRFDKPRLDLAFALVKAGSGAQQLNGLDAVRDAVAARITFRQCWQVLAKMRAKDRVALLKRITDADRQALLEGVPTLVRPQLERDITLAVGPPASEITLHFVPDVSEIPARQAPHGPQPLGEITVLHKGKPVMSIPARGGPWQSYGDRGHTADPTAPGTYALGPITAHTTTSWPFSQLANGTPIRPNGTDVEYQRDGRWRSVTTLPKPLDPQEILLTAARVAITAEYRATSDPAVQAALKKEYADTQDPKNTTTRPLPTEWILNDFGTANQRVEGSPGVFLHTTDVTDDATAALQPGHLDFSHGCIHVLASDRRKLVSAGFLKQGVKVKVEPYTKNSSGWQKLPGM